MSTNEIIKRIKKEDPNWKENMKKGYYLPKCGNCGDTSGSVILLTILCGILLGIVLLLQYILK